MRGFGLDWLLYAAAFVGGLQACGSGGPSRTRDGCRQGTVLQGDTCVPASPTAGGEPAASGPADVVAVALPLHVADYFSPAFMGDGESGFLSLADECPDGAAAEGETCQTFVYSAGGPAGWAGVYWLNPVDNWGVVPGLSVAPNAASVVWRAWVASGALVVKFVAGGVGVGMEHPPAYSDSFKAEQEFTLTEAPTEYSLDLTGVAYAQVVGGFAWAAAAPPGSDVTIYLSAIRWLE